MKIRKIFTLAFAITSLTTVANDKVIYGEDNRLDLFEVTNSMHLELASATAGMVTRSKIKDHGEDNVLIKGSKINLCSEDRFSDQITAPSCSGFLVEHEQRQYLVTAGHCISSQRNCESWKWVFGFAKNTEDQTDHVIPKSNVYSCKRLLERKLTRSSKDDYAIIELDRKVEGVKPLRMRQSGELQVGEEVLVIGHPTGLPTKVADGAFVRKTSHRSYFETNLDTFAGNSGSAVFNANTGEVEGILVRGHTDYKWTRDQNGSCKTPVVCEMDSCLGEEVTKISSIDFFRNN